MSLRSLVRCTLRKGWTEAEFEELVRGEPKTVRYFLGMSYSSDEEVRKTGVRGVAIASRHHPKLVGKVVRRLIWAMNDESATNALTAPEVLRAVARERPELLLPVVGDLTRLAADPGLQEGLAETLKIVASRCPGQVGESLGRSLSKRFHAACGEEP